MSNYLECPASATTSSFVHSYWVFRGSESAERQYIVPDGRPEVILHLGDPYREVRAGQLQSRIALAGQLTRPLTLLASGKPWVVGVRLRPDGALPLTGQSTHVLTDRRLDFQDCHDALSLRLIERLRDLDSPHAQIGAVEQVMALVLDGAEPDWLVRGAVDRLMRTEPIERPVSIGSRQFQRRFRKAVGISARKFAAIRRFRSVFDRLIDVENESWAIRALETGYFDQPQMARDFSRFLGCSAREWMRQAGELGAAIGATKG